MDLSDYEQPDIAPRDDYSADQELLVEANQEPDDQDDQVVDVQDSSDFEPQDGTQTDSTRRRNRRSWAPNAGGLINEVQPYPTDPSQKWTRTYVGPVKRWTRLWFLLDYWYGDKDDRRHVFYDFIKLWWQFELLPPKLPQESSELERARNGWMPDNFAQDLEGKFRHWYERHLSIRPNPQSSTIIDEATAFQWFLPQAGDKMSVLLGHVSNQKEYHIKQGESIPFSDSGLPIGDEDNQDGQNGGWLLDVGGTVLSMAWAPIQGQVDQLLAMTVIPYSDQAFYENLNDAPKESELKEGAVQIWKVELEKDLEGIIRPSRSSPKLVHAMGFPWGRCTQLQWCPVPLTAKGQVSLLAVLCGDGGLRILEIKQDREKDTEGFFEALQEPMATILPPKEHTLEINCFTWVNMNRVAVALSDGSVVIWSLSPCQQLQRHPIHSSPIMDIVSGYPSKPYIVATMPMGGVFTLTDLNRPTAEKTYHGNPLVSLQPNVLAWNDHLRGFASIWPTSFPGTSTISFVQSRVFPLSRHICTVDGQTTCLAFGTCHPFLLAGSSDGSVWTLNVMRKVASHKQKTHKMKLFQHEYCSPSQPDAADEGREAGSRRGACRILHGFQPQANFHPLGTRIAKESRVKRIRRDKKGGNKKAQELGDDEVSDEPAEAEDDKFTMVPGPIIVHDPLTRITALSWNPNAEFSWWAAAAMGSGLVRIMDLGIEKTGGNTDKDGDQEEVVEPEDDEPGYETEMEDDTDEDVNMTACD
ncbi:WD40 repeat-like protein [Hypoxylon sp. NC1633]|nr:WD40 repeat-like protein [Hypoxylon sp. NC1633]